MVRQVFPHHSVVFVNAQGNVRPNVHVKACECGAMSHSVFKGRAIRLLHWRDRINGQFLPIRVDRRRTNVRADVHPPHSRSQGQLTRRHDRDFLSELLRDSSVQLCLPTAGLFAIVAWVCGMSIRIQVSLLVFSFNYGNGEGLTGKLSVRTRGYGFTGVGLRGGAV